MICVSIAEKSAGRCLAVLKGLDFAEIRMEDMKLTVDDIHNIFSQPLKLIATCRPGKLPVRMRRDFLINAIQAGASYVDIEIESDREYKAQIVKAAKMKGCKVIISFHDYKETPGLERLEGTISRCFDEGADVAKIACTVRSDQDNAKLLGLLGREPQGKKLLVVGMGEKGKITRMVAPFLGSPFSYASLSEGQETADGQLTKERLEKIMRLINDT